MPRHKKKGSGNKADQGFVKGLRVHRPQDGARRLGFRAWRPLASSLQPRSFSPAFWSPGGAVPLSGGARAQISASEAGEGTQETRGCARPTPLGPQLHRLRPSTSPTASLVLPGDRLLSPRLFSASLRPGWSQSSLHQAWWGRREGSASARPPSPSPSPGVLASQRTSPRPEGAGAMAAAQAWVRS